MAERGIKGEKKGAGTAGPLGGAGGPGGDRQRRGFGGRGGRDGKGGPRKGGPQPEEWRPVTKLGRLVQAGIIKSVEEIFRFSIPIKESQIVNTLLEGKLKEEVMKVKPVQKQTQAGQRTRFKCVVLIGDYDCHIGIGGKVDKEVQGAVKGAIIDAKLNLIPVRKGYWGNKIGKPHTVPMKLTGKCGSVRVRLVPAPRGTGLVASPAPNKVLQMAGIQDCYTSTEGMTNTRQNTLRATYEALVKTYKFLTPDLWKKTKYDLTIVEKFREKAGSTFA